MNIPRPSSILVAVLAVAAGWACSGVSSKPAAEEKSLHAEGRLASGPNLPGCLLMWSPSAMRDGEKAFELAEMPDRQFPGGSPGTHQGVTHISTVVDHDAYSIDSHYHPPNAIDYDRVTQSGPTRTDRIRSAARGMVGPLGQLDLLNGQTWRLSWSFYVPSSLIGGRRFTHIMQMKFVDLQGGSRGTPVITVTLGGGDTIGLRLWLGGGNIATISMAGLHDKWLKGVMTVKIAPEGSVRWVLSDGATTIVDKEQAMVSWTSEMARLRPKWGIYRGITCRNTEHVHTALGFPCVSV